MAASKKLNKDKVERLNNINMWIMKINNKKEFHLIKII